MGSAEDKKQTTRHEEVFELLPRSWRSQLAAARCEPVRSGASGAQVWRLRGKSSPDRYLKLATGCHKEQVRQEIIRTAWLGSHGANVPPILKTVVRPDVAAILVAALPGEPIESCDLPPDTVIESLARGLSALHSLPVEPCPFDETIQTRLKRAAAAVANKRIDQTHFRSQNLAMTPEGLFRRLVTSPPLPEDLVVVHGDATFTNILMDGSRQIGFIDCGHSGKSDRYTDLALVGSEIEERYGAEWLRAFYRSYGLTAWDTRKAEFFLDLYEFF